MDKCKLSVISQERLNIEVKLLLSANRKSYMYMPRRLAQQRMTLSDLNVRFRIARYFCYSYELFVVQGPCWPVPCVNISHAKACTHWHYFTGLLPLMNIFQHVQCRSNNFEIISDVVTYEIKHWNNIEVMSVFYVACQNRQWSGYRPYMWNITLKLFQNYFKINYFRPITHVTTAFRSIFELWIGLWVGL